MLQINHAIKYFNKGTPNEVLALDNISLQIPNEEFLIIIGSNGSGKTTLLNLIAGTYFPDAGNILIDKKDITSKRDFERSRWIARVFQDPMAGTAPELTILDNFRLASLRTKRKTFKSSVENNFKNKVKERLSLLNMGLENKTGTLVGKLSGGQRQALTLLMAVMDEAKILLLDEPTAALDPKSAEIIMQTAGKVIRESQLTAILVTHDMRYAREYGSRLIMMRQGKIFHDIAPEEKNKLSTTDLMQWFA